MTREDIRQIRKTYGMTQGRFGSALGVSSQTMFFWEKGVNAPSGHQQIILHRLSAMAKNPQQFARAKDALSRAQFMRPGFEPETAPGSVDLNTCGLGLMLAALFKTDEDYGLDRLRAIKFTRIKNSQEIAFTECLEQPLSDETQFRVTFNISRQRALKIKKMLKKAVSQLDELTKG